MNEINDLVATFADYQTQIVIAVVGFVFTVIALTWIRRAARRWRFGAERDVVAKHWADVENLIDRGDDMSLRLALIQADAVLDLALKAKAFPGTTTGERLKFASRKYRQLRQTFWARSLRNRLVHEAGAEVSTGELRRAVGELKRALETLGAL
jgi:hypothetical protein